MLLQQLADCRPDGRRTEDGRQRTVPGFQLARRIRRSASCTLNQATRLSNEKRTTARTALRCSPVTHTSGSRSALSKQTGYESGNREHINNERLTGARPIAAMPCTTTRVGGHGRRTLGPVDVPHARRERGLPPVATDSAGEKSRV